MLDIDLQNVPFSRFGSYLAVSQLEGKHHDQTDVPPGLWLRNMHGEVTREVFHLQTIHNGGTIPFDVEPSIDELRLRTDEGLVRLCITDSEQLRIRTEGIGLRLQMQQGGFNCAVEQPDDQWLFNALSALRNYTVVRLNGKLSVDAPWQTTQCERIIADITPGQNGVGECVIHQTRGHQPLPEDYPTYETSRGRVASDFESFLGDYPTVPDDLQETARKAAYINWASVVDPCDHFQRPAMLMSKNWMCNVWSWDHCFNAMALAEGRPRLAWDQFMLIFDHQTQHGQLPDMINDVLRQYNFVKPPVHGWTYRKMMTSNDWFRTPERMAEAYDVLADWTRWWQNFRTPDGEELPRYYHGNDSGWDNGTVFDVGEPVKGADLGALLSIQMEVLADLASRLGRGHDAEHWRKRSDAILKALLEDLWAGDRFVSRHAHSGEVNEQAQSIIPCTPILLGQRLPQSVREPLVERIRENLTDWGPATENPDSPLYEPDGYWRGPIWAPPTLIMVDGLRRSGETKLADTISRRFCRLCARSGFAENFDAVTGEPLRDKAYTWTASTFFMLASS